MFNVYILKYHFQFQILLQDEFNPPSEGKEEKGGETRKVKNCGMVTFTNRFKKDLDGEISQHNSFQPELVIMDTDVQNSIMRNIPAFPNLYYISRNRANGLKELTEQC